MTFAARNSRAWNLGLAACVLWLAAAGAPARGQELPEAAREALTRANNAIRQQQWLLAEQQLKIAYDKRSDSPEILLALAQFSERKGGRDLIAAAWYRTYLTTNPDAKDREQIKAKIASLEQGAISVARGFIDRAISTASNIAASDRSGILTNIASAQAEIGDISGAFSTASSARSANPNAYGDDPFGRVAQTLAGRGNLSGAEDALRRVDAAKRSSALQGVVSALTSAKRPADALAYAAPTTGANRISAYTYIANAYSDAGDRNAARSNLSTAIDAANGVEQSSRRSYLLSLAETASNIGEFDTARRLYAEASKFYKLTDKYDVYYLNSTKWTMTKNLAKWGRLAEAEALFPSVFHNDPDPSHAWYRTSARSDIESAHVKATEELIKKGKLAEAESALAKEPWPGAYAKPRLIVANAYLAKGERATAHKLLDAASVSISKGTVAEAGTAFNYVLARRDLSDAYINVGDLAASRRILDATAATISKITNADQKRYPLEYTAGAFTRLAKAYSSAKNYANAKSAAAAVFKLINLMSNADDRASALSSLSDLDPQVGLLGELAAALPSIQSGYSRQNVVKALVKSYASNHQDSDTVAMAARIDDLNDRKSTLWSLMSVRADAKNWSGALALANDPGVSGRLYAELAYKMLVAGMFKEAAELESKFAAGSGEADTYYSYLAVRQAESNDTENALKSAFRIAAITSRIRTLFSIASSVDAIAGRAAARPIAERAIAQFAELKTPLARSETCYAIDNYLFYGTDFSELLQPNPDNSVIALACMGEAFEILDQNSRLSRAQTSLSYPKLATRPFMSKALVPTRRAISRVIAEAHGSSDSSQVYPAAEAASRLAQEGAAEAAVELAGDPSSSYSGNVIKAAVGWLAETGDADAARRVLEQYVAGIAAMKDESSRDSRYSSAIGAAVLIPEFDRALKLSADIKSSSSRISALVDVGRAAITRSRFEVALAALDRAKAAAVGDSRNYYLSYMSDIAAQAGDKNAEAYIAEVAKQDGLSAEVSARDTLIRELLKWKQRDRALALLPAQEAALAKLPVSDRWSYRANYFAAHLASLGDTARLDKLVAAAPLPENKVSLLMSAADAFSKADRKDAAQVALARAIESANAVALPASKVSYLQSIASYYITAGNADAARATLARAIEATPAIPAVGSRSSYLRWPASTYARLGDEQTARTLLKRSLDELKLTRPDFAGWADFTIAIAHESSEPEKAARQALAIADPYWRNRAVQSLVGTRIAAGRMPDALALIKSAQPSPSLDQTVMRLIRVHLGKREIEPARALIGKLSHPGLRNDARRMVVLFQAHQGGVEAALAETATIEDKLARAYTLVDLGWVLGGRSTDKRSQSAYFAQLAFFVAAKLAEQVSDVQDKIDVLAAAAHGQNALEDHLGAAALARAEALSSEIADERARRYAVRWAKAPEAAARPDPVASEARSEWSYRARSGLDSDQYKDAEAFIQSLAAKNPSERANNLANAASNYGSQIAQMRQKAVEFDRKREALAR